MELKQVHYPKGLDYALSSPPPQQKKLILKLFQHYLQQRDNT